MEKMWTGGAAEGGAAANGGAASAAQQQARLELALNSNEFGEDEYVQVSCKGKASCTSCKQWLYLCPSYSCDLRAHRAYQ
jgi:hypothetical protein